MTVERITISTQDEASMLDVLVGHLRIRRIDIARDIDNPAIDSPVITMSDNSRLEFFATANGGVRLQYVRVIP